ncbi:hypothetical protein [Natronobacterium gregoryi]|uniref:Uncharacterized protein n=2 Tax=Natronobacterium gregoryi TaxID=44930 RepID=L0ANJ4_NATGS|nr:hypothetical protein [Natronobacterium gregoryi]AFZ74625.1 hypothetical protein Natgr_3506 [Natronobacterium gregoryi SP2]ELY72556.1 hypothetical protein C490_03168 [Natronobacterium gregoryi SP2]PLK19810.1 hypothetical protein CYV19_12945 [Natronobacterium gregoryi SP2]SFJ30740.1 hypothetical protein SAMN05443661_12143 [Natronobacterium gregoryi]
MMSAESEFSWLEGILVFGFVGIFLLGLLTAINIIDAGLVFLWNELEYAYSYAVYLLQTTDELTITIPTDELTIGLVTGFVVGIIGLLVLLKLRNLIVRFKNEVV